MYSSIEFRGSTIPIAPKSLLFNALKSLAFGGMLIGLGVLITFIGVTNLLIPAITPFFLFAAVSATILGSAVIIGGIGGLLETVNTLKHYHHDHQNVKHWRRKHGYSKKAYDQLISDYETEKKHKDQKYKMEVQQAKEAEKAEDHAREKLAHLVVQDLKSNHVTFASLFHSKKDALSSNRCEKIIYNTIYHASIIKKKEIKSIDDLKDYAKHLSDAIRNSDCFNKEGTFTIAQRKKMEKAIIDYITPDTSIDKPIDNKTMSPSLEGANNNTILPAAHLAPNPLSKHKVFEPVAATKRSANVKQRILSKKEAIPANAYPSKSLHNIETSLSR